ncbi:MAG: hypothetical protein KIT81_16280 [Alphaproteobacteria bacterium]|nr:hypothetical protein [Alphaproteobacteria bacterium]
MNAFQHAATLARRWREEIRLPQAARRERTRDRQGLPQNDPGAATAIAAGLEWLCQAQDRSATKDGGAARHYSLLTGWASSYPETSGYIVPTLLREARLSGDPKLEARARRMLDWLVSIQFPEGGFQGGVVDALPRVPVTFNTGQILLGLAAGAAELDRARYLEPMRKAAQWLVDSQDGDGCWRRHPTPFAKPGEKAYETHVAWGLFEADRVLPGLGFGETGLRQVRWAIACQHPNGWFEKCCLSDAERPLTHTLGYVLRGIIEAYRLMPADDLLMAAIRTADGLLGVLEPDGRLPGRLDKEWRAAAPWVCLTGSVQIAHCWFLLSDITGNAQYREGARLANRYVRRTLVIDGQPEVRGGVKGSFPVDGGYGRFEYLNWACKFMIDANRMELDHLAKGATDRVV